MPRKNPWMTTPSGTDTSKAWKLAQRIAMLAPQKPTAPPIAIAPSLGCRTKASAVRVPSAKVAGTVASRWAARPNRPEVWPLDAALDVIRQEREQQADDDRGPREGRRNHSAGQGRLA